MERTCSKYGSRYLQIRDHIPNKGHEGVLWLNACVSKHPAVFSLNLLLRKEIVKYQKYVLSTCCGGGKKRQKKKKKKKKT